MFCVPGVNLAHEARTIAKHEVQKLRAEIRELRTGTGSTAVLAKAWEEGEKLRHERRNHSAYDVHCGSGVGCRGVVRHPVSVGKHTVH